MPKVSIVIPNYNHGRFLRQRIASVLRQTYQDFEVIMLDDCSTDESRLILSEYASDPRITLEFNTENSANPFKQWNKGVRLARAEYVWIAESDDYADSTFLEKLLGVLDAEPSAAFAFCRSWRILGRDQLDGFAVPLDMGGSESHRWTKDYYANGLEECRFEFIHQNIVPNASAVVFRRGVYQQVGGADQRFRLCGDWKLWAAMALTGKVAYLAEPLNYYRFHDASIRSVMDKTGAGIAEILQVRWWILDQATRSETPVADPNVQRRLANACMELAFRCYPEFSGITRLALQRAQELGGADFTPPFSTWKGDLLRKTFGWKATRRAHVLYHRFFKTARNAMAEVRALAERKLRSLVF